MMLHSDSDAEWQNKSIHISYNPTFKYSFTRNDTKLIIVVSHPFALYIGLWQVCQPKCVLPPRVTPKVFRKLQSRLYIFVFIIIFNFTSVVPSSPPQQGLQGIQDTLSKSMISFFNNQKYCTFTANSLTSKEWKAPYRQRFQTENIWGQCSGCSWWWYKYNNFAFLHAHELWPTSLGKTSRSDTVWLYSILFLLIAALSTVLVSEPETQVKFKGFLCLIRDEEKSEVKQATASEAAGTVSCQPRCSKSEWRSKEKINDDYEKVRVTEEKPQTHQCISKLPTTWHGGADHNGSDFRGE